MVRVDIKGWFTTYKLLKSGERREYHYHRVTLRRLRANRDHRNSSRIMPLPRNSFGIALPARSMVLYAATPCQSNSKRSSRRVHSQNIDGC